MSKSSIIEKNQGKLHLQFKALMEDAYNFRQTDAALSDIAEYRALKLLEKINRLRFLNRDALQTIS